MKCCLSDLRYKEVIDLTTGQRLGYVCDAEIDLEQGKIVSLIVPGQKKARRSAQRR
ncbi:MAG: YlmC/YmxH family sporulation protein [Oscillospiraceae bacterium]